MDETDVIARLRRIATDPAARGLADDAALLDGLVLTHDSIAENVHFFSSDPPASVGWKLVAVNLSDLAAKGAEPAGALLGMALGDDPAWDSEFLTGVEHACESYRLPLIGGDTIALPPASARVFGLTAIGRAGARVPDRAGGRPGDRLWLVGTLGDSAAGLRQLRADRHATGALVDVYRRPVPLLAAGRALAPHAQAMMDVSDGLLLDSRRMAEASGCVIEIDLDRLPLSDAFVEAMGEGVPAGLFAASGGDDYALLAALAPQTEPETLCLPSGTRLSAIGTLREGPPQVRLTSGGQPVELPESLGFEHSRNHDPGGSAPLLADRP